MDIKENVRMEGFTTLGVGGAARYFCVVKNKQELVEACDWARSKSLSVFVLGDGSNILVADKGLNALVVKNELRGIDIRPFEGACEIKAAAGENWHNFVMMAVGNGLQGVECLAGIPGTVGAAPIQNINAYGQGADGVIKEVEVYDMETGEFKTLLKKDCGFGYRDSILKREAKGKYAVVSVTFLLPVGGKPALSYHSLASQFQGREPSAWEVAEEVVKIRAKKGMVLLPGYEKLKSAGSFFINPSVKKDVFKKIVPLASACRAADGVCCREPWYWKQASGLIKISAACLMHMAGFAPGVSDGPVGISPHHALAVINAGGAKALQIKKFAEKIKLEVKNKFGVELQTEPELVGF